MMAGHFGLAAGVKSRAPSVPLWALMLATQWLDVVFVPLLLTHRERFEPVPGTHGGYGETLIYADYTHSLLGAAVLAITFGLVAAIAWGRRAGLVLGGVVFSHWLIDLLVHRGDMPVLPGNALDLPRLGFGLWRFPVVTCVAELALVVGGAWLYARAARQVAAPDRLRTANASSAVVLFAGLIGLALNLVGM